MSAPPPTAACWRLVVQACESASLAVGGPPGAPDVPPGREEIGRGLLLFVSFFRPFPTGAEGRERMRQGVAALLALQGLVPAYGAGRARSIAQALGAGGEAGCDLLVIPQACVGGRPKGRALQYHALAERAAGRELYDAFVAELREQAAAVAGAGGCRVACGTFGNLQGLSMTSRGPSTHVLDDL